VTPVISKTETTLADLAALAAKKVPGFVHPSNHCPVCYGHGSVDGQTCYECDDAARVEDNSPAALAMAVLVFCDLTEVGQTYASCSGVAVGEAKHSRNPESIARALLTALLRAHGVEVPSE
jgi:hypothetical protein